MHRTLAASLAFALPSSAQDAVTLREQHRMVPIEAFQPFESWLASFADVDGDGDRDALVSGKLLVNDGDGVFDDSSALAFLPIDRVPRQGALADLDNDGDADLVQVAFPNELYVAHNDGLGHFTSVGAPYVFVGSAYVGEFDLGDLDGDGDLDVLVPRHDDRDFEDGVLFLGDGAGGLVATLVSQPGSPISDHVAVALVDLEGDGDLDVLALGDPTYNGLSGFGTPNRILINAGGGALAPLTAVLPAGQLVASDVDGDGDLDLWSGTSALLLNDGTNHFVDGSAGLPSLPDSLRVVEGDLDGDGDADVVASNADTSFTLVNDGAAHFALLPDRWPGLPSGSTAIDVDGDGDLDVFHSNGALFNRGDGRFAWHHATDRALDDDAANFALADLDGDRYPDAIAFGDGGARVFLNRGDAKFLELLASGLPTDLVHALAVADLDGDGDQDVAAAQLPAMPRIFLNDGSGRFVLGPTLPATASTFSVQPTAGDLDGDGDVDLIASGGPVSVLLGVRAAHFTELPAAWPASVPYGPMALGDLDGDLDLDVVVRGGTGLSALVNDGSGRFAVHGNVSTVPQLRQPFLGDVDADGDLDCVAANASWPHVNVLALNDGSANFSDASASLPVAADAGWANELVDLDGDGDLDVALWNYTALRMFQNDGQGVFANASSISNETYPPRPLWADLDLDGDLDAAGRRSSSEIAVLANLSRQLAWRTPPRIGRELEFEVHGPPGRQFKLYGSLGRAQLPFGPLGTLAIDRSRIVVEAGGTLDDTGTARAVRQIPAELALVGVEIHWQALLADPRRLTNLEVTQLDDF